MNKIVIVPGCTVLASGTGPDLRVPSKVLPEPFNTPSDKRFNAPPIPLRRSTISAGCPSSILEYES